MRGHAWTESGAMVRLMQGTTVAAGWPGVEHSGPHYPGVPPRLPKNATLTLLGWACPKEEMHHLVSYWVTEETESLGRAQWAEEEIGSSPPGKLLLCARHRGPELMASRIGSTQGNHLSLFCGYKGKQGMTWLNGQSQRAWLVLLLYNLLMCVLSQVIVPLWI